MIRVPITFGFSPAGWFVSGCVAVESVVVGCEPVESVAAAGWANAVTSSGLSPTLLALLALLGVGEETNVVALTSSGLSPTLLALLALLGDVECCGLTANPAPLLTASANAFKSINGVRPSLPSLTTNDTGSLPGVVNVTIVLRPSAPRWVVTVGVFPSSPASPLAPSLIRTVVGCEPSWLSIVISTPLFPSSLRTAVTVGDTPFRPSLITANGFSGFNGCPGLAGSSW